ncbi:MAG: hypothetical protein QM811_24485 [Pirellulales bacterium]
MDRGPTHLSTHNFVCDGCGASMSYDAGTQGLRCPFCGSEKMTPDADTREVQPQGIVPFAVSRAQAETSLRKWLAGSFWSPNDSAGAAIVTSLQGIYLPYWIFAADTETYWTADSSATPPGAYGDWVPVSGEHRGRYDNNLVCCSSALTPDEMAKIGNYDLSQAVPPGKIALDGVTNERFTVPRKYARPLARRGFEARELDACRRYVAGNVRNLRVNVRIAELSSYPMLLPVWIVAYRYRDRLYRFLANGQTGAATGIAPISVTKVVGAVTIALIILGLILAFALFH